MCGLILLTTYAFVVGDIVPCVLALSGGTAPWICASADGMGDHDKTNNLIGTSNALFYAGHFTCLSALLQLTRPLAVKEGEEQSEA